MKTTLDNFQAKLKALGVLAYSREEKIFFSGMWPNRNNQKVNRLLQWIINNDHLTIPILKDLPIPRLYSSLDGKTCGFFRSKPDPSLWSEVTSSEMEYLQANGLFLGGVYAP